MSYIAIYRKFRPKVFSQVIGQGHVTTTLKNQVISGRISHAYLFCGTRGTGKTSAAKILARAVNCLEPNEGEPCNKCKACKSIESNSIMDVIEIDAASNRGVDEIRDLREKVKYPPTIGVKKVYIIDEVHMLTTEAFNALLKTLEEPPEHVMFILATTEPHKLPATILSRCQRYDFKRLSIEDIVYRMKYVCDNMNIHAEEKALELIASNAEGAMRDALSILDQCITMIEDENELKSELINDILGLADEKVIINLTQSIIDKDVNELMFILKDAVSSGKDIFQLNKQMIQHFRDLLIVKSVKESNKILETTQEKIETLNKQARHISNKSIYSFIEILSENENKMKYFSQPKILLEMTLIKLYDSLNVEDFNYPSQRSNNVETNTKIHASTNKKSFKEMDKPNKIHMAKKQNDENTNKDKKIEENIKDNLTMNSSNNLQNINKNWKTIIQNFKVKKPAAATFLKEGKPIDIVNNQIIINFDKNHQFHKMTINQKDNKRLLEEIISEIMQQKLSVELVTKETLDSDNSPYMKAVEVFGSDKVELIDK